MPEKIKVLLVENDLDFVYLIKKMIDEADDLIFADHAENRSNAAALAAKYMPDIVLMDLNLSKNELDGIEAAKEIRLATHAKILLLTSFESPEIIIQASKRAFASGYIFKSQSQTLVDTIRKTAQSDTPQAQFIKELILQDLSHAERNVIKNILYGSSETHSSFKTIANQKTQIFKKLGIKNTQQLIHLFENW